MAWEATPTGKSYGKKQRDCSAGNQNEKQMTETIED